jgi:hypothetical protein
MTYRGKVQNGVVILEVTSGMPPVPEGAEVSVEVLATPKETLGQRLMKLAGIAPGLPTDMARNHDHYIHGASKRQ